MGNKHCLLVARSWGRGVLLLRVFFGLGVVLWACCAMAGTNRIVRSVNIPILTVVGNSGQYGCVELLLEQDPESTRPLFVSVAEEMPMGSGEVLRASVWQAAVTVALLRRDPLTGTRLTYQIDGRIDGPSAGCALALGLMAALDGRSLPDDFAVTGAVLPDGSIGRVGGIHLKMMAARLAKKKRILVPACLRFEYDEQKAVDIDLKVLADTLGLEYVPVGTLQEAYAAILGLPKAPENGVDEELKLPGYMDDYYKDLYGREMRRYSELLKSSSGATDEEPASDLYAMALETWGAGMQAAAADYIDVAAVLLRDGLAEIEAYAQIEALVDQFDGWAFIRAMQAKVDELLNLECDPYQLLEQLRDRNLSLSVTPFMSDLATGAALRSFVRDLETASVPDSTSAVALADTNTLYDAVVLESYRGRISTWVNQTYAAYDERILDINGYFTDDTLTAAPCFAHVEHLLFSSLLTTKNTFDAMMNVPGEESNLATLYGLLLFSNPELALPMGQLPHELHQAVQRAAGEKKLYLCAVAVQVYVKYIAEMNRWILLLGELDPVWLEDGSMQLRRHGLLHKLLQVSRARAEASIKACRDRQLPWLAAYLEFRCADYGRDDPSADKTDVLAGYWTAALQSDAVMMLFESGSYGRNVRRMLRSTFVEVTRVAPACQLAVRELEPGDKIVKVDGIEVRSVDELQSVVAAMPEGYEYSIVYMPKGAMQAKSIRVTGGRMLGVEVKNYKMF